MNTKRSRIRITDEKYINLIWNKGLYVRKPRCRRQTSTWGRSSCRWPSAGWRRCPDARWRRCKCTCRFFIFSLFLCHVHPNNKRPPNYSFLIALPLSVIVSKLKKRSSSCYSRDLVLCVYGEWVSSVQVVLHDIGRVVGHAGLGGQSRGTLFPEER